MTSPTEPSRTPAYTLYTTSSGLADSSYVGSALTGAGSYGWTLGNQSGAAAFMLDFGTMSLKMGEKIIVTFEAWAPNAPTDSTSQEDLDELASYYYEASVNNTLAGMSSGIVTSPPAKVILMPTDGRTWQPCLA